MSTQPPPGTLKIGTSGWSYPSGRGTWNGIFYPRAAERGPGFDELAFYAERFDTVEVNSTFYGQPRAQTTIGWVRRTPPGFEFSVKLFQKFTHPGMAADRAPVSRADVDQFRGGIEPLAAAGRLGMLLAQFPPSFHREPAAEAYLDWLLTTFRDYPVALELRHRTWSDAADDTRALVARHGATWVEIDEPKFESSIRQAAGDVTGPRYYARLHGRNAAAWWHHAAAEDRYDYLYSEAELRPFAETMARARAAVRKAYLYLNNHFAAQAVADATMVRDLVGEPVTALMPAELVERYPMLEGRVATLRRAQLF
ncbi:MAG: DUF72 domain-containing protein [Vicinamibacterales bacterium]